MLDSDLDDSWIYANSQNLVAVSLRKDVPSPIAPRNDEESDKKDKDKPADKDKDKPGPGAAVDALRPSYDLVTSITEGQCRSS